MLTLARRSSRVWSPACCNQAAKSQSRSHTIVTVPMSSYVYDIPLKSVGWRSYWGRLWPSAMCGRWCKIFSIKALCLSKQWPYVYEAHYRNSTNSYTLSAIEFSWFCETQENMLLFLHAHTQTGTVFSIKGWVFVVGFRLSSHRIRRIDSDSPWKLQ